MDLFAALVALGRRWYLTIVLLALVMGGTYAAAKSTKPDYKASASVILLAPRQDLTKSANLGNVNPYLGAGTPTFANVLSRVMVSDVTVREVVAQHGTRNFTVGQGASTNGPIINIDATDVSPVVATRTCTILISLIGREAAQRQQVLNIAPASYITIQTITAGDQPSKLQGSRTRVTIAVGAMGVVFTFATVLLIDSWLMARRARRRRGGRRDGDEGSTSGEDTGDGSNAGQDLPLARVRP
jgi:capsular polysaccharide biosynthesis protein